MRNNSLVALFDLAKRHTALLDRHLPSMALAICDEAPFVRRQALMLFTQLLLEDYVKWKPAIFRAFCAALADKESSQRSTAHACLFNLLLPRQVGRGLSVGCWLGMGCKSVFLVRVLKRR